LHLTLCNTNHIIIQTFLILKAITQGKELQVWQKAIDYADNIINLIDHLNSERKHYRLTEQLESTVTSIALNPVKYG
jgi:hypothetical protein